MRTSLKTILALFSFSAAGGLGQTWIQTSAPSADWTSIASSADGSKLLAAGNGVIYSSTNSGLTWNPVDLPTTNWSCVACSANGQKLFAFVAAEGGPIYRS